MRHHNKGNQPLNIFIGWDSRQDIAYQVCCHALLRHTAFPLKIIPLKQAALRRNGIYTRPHDPLAATEFTYTRFLVPHLAGYSGWALFVDCDFLFTADIVSLFALQDDRYAIRCVKHDYTPSEETKMDGRIQTVYPRKNWSSLVLWNCGHPAHRSLTPDAVNRETGSFLHRFCWLEDDLIGELPESWNWLEGWSTLPQEGAPQGIHFTRGGPWFENWQHVQYANLWLAERQRLGTAGDGEKIRRAI